MTAFNQKFDNLNSNSKIASSRSYINDELLGHQSLSTNANNLLNNNSPQNTNSNNFIKVTSSNSNLGGQVMKMKKLKIIGGVSGNGNSKPTNFPANANLRKYSLGTNAANGANKNKDLASGVTSNNANINSGVNGLNSHLSNREIQPSITNLNPLGNSSSNNKLTFDSVFNFKKNSQPVIINNSLMNNNSNQNGSSMSQGLGPISQNFNNVFSQQQQIQIPNSSIVLNGNQQPQISININNFNINNYNVNSYKLKKSSPVNVGHTANFMDTTPVQISNSSHQITKTFEFLKQSKKIIAQASEKQSDKNIEKLPDNIKGTEKSENKFKFSSKISEPSPKKLSISNSKKKNKIQTIIDGNNDSFINELADLLNNVDNNPKESGKIKDDALILMTEEEETMEINLQDYMRKSKIEVEDQLKKEEVTPDPRINFAQLQMVNSKRPQTSYGGISARQKSLQKSLRQKSSKVTFGRENREEELFPMPKEDGFNDFYLDRDL